MNAPNDDAPNDDAPDPAASANDGANPGPDGPAPRLTAEVWLGPATEAAAIVYVRPRLVPSERGSIEQPAPATALRLVGALRGPRSQFCRTLAAESPLVDRGHDPRWLASASVAEPCYWSPETPMLYDLAVRAIDPTGRAVAAADLVTGLVRFATDGPSLRLDGRRFVFRGWRPPPEWRFDGASLREAGVGLWGERFDDATGAAAAAWGSPLLEVEPTEADRPAAVSGPLQRSHWPCLLRPGADLRVWRSDSGEPLTEAIASGTPVAAARRDESIGSPEAAFRACQRLQADLAPHTGLAGYLV